MRTLKRLLGLDRPSFKDVQIEMESAFERVFLGIKTLRDENDACIEALSQIADALKLKARDPRMIAQAAIAKIKGTAPPPVEAKKNKRKRKRRR